MNEKDVWQRLVELVKDDKELHDAVVRAINAYAEDKETRSRARTRNVRKALGGPEAGKP